jgi:hypothetical protein
MRYREIDNGGETPLSLAFGSGASRLSVQAAA